MNVINKFLIPALALGMFAACSDDNKFEGPETPDNNNPCFVSVDLNLAVSGGRAINDGNEPTEIGQDYENQIHNAVIVLADKTTRKIIAAVKVDDKISGSGSANPSITAKFSQTEIETYRSGIGPTATPEIYVFALCNCPANLATELTNIKWDTPNAPTDWAEKYTTYTSNDLKITNIKANGIFMTSTSPTGWTLPSKSELANSSATAPLSVGTITVKRTIARFDYADGSEGNGLYTVYNSKNDKNVPDNDSRIKVQIIRVGTVNISSNFFNFPHAADNYNNISDVKAFSTGSYVVDYKADEKDEAHSKQAAWMGENYFSTLFDFTKVPFNNELNRGGWESDDYAHLLSGDADSWNDNTNEAPKPDYRIWRYVTENVIPSASNQNNGISTGIVFKGKIVIDGEGEIAKQFKKTMAEGKTLYVFNGSKQVSAIGGLSDIAELTAENNIYAAMAQCLKDGKSLTDENLTDEDVDKAKATAAGFTMYQAAENILLNGDQKGEYYMYYYYWNRHFDNNDNSDRGVMEFATVRNNVYKLSLTGISKFGHPRKPENDPDPLKPETPDEDANAYITVSLQILPWDVRVNNIEF